MKINNLFFLFLILSSFLVSKDKIATIEYIDGEVIIANDRSEQYSLKAIVGRNIYSGDEIKVSENSNCFISLVNNKTHIQISPNSIIKINQDEFSNSIELKSGNIYVKNLYSDRIKTYVFTEHNQVYLNNHRIWFSSKWHGLDNIFSLDSDIQVYNTYAKKMINIFQRKLSSINLDGIVSHYDDVEEIVPSFVLLDIDSFNYDISEMKLIKYDMIPMYDKRIKSNNVIDPYNIYFDFGTEFLNSNTHIKVGLYPQYKYKNLLFSMNLEMYASPSGTSIDDNWDDFYDIIEKVRFKYSKNDDKKDMSLYFGNINKVSFGTGYLLNNLNNTIDYPRLRHAGLLLNYKFDVDFMDLQIVTPNIRDFKNSGGIIGARTSLFISHRFPLTLGFGIVADLNQFSQISNYLNKGVKQRSLYSTELDFNYSVVSNIDFEFDIFGEMVGIWYPDDNYYILYEGGDVSDDLRWRKGSWGINAPGVSFKFDNRYLLKLSFNYNSATFIPNYFNSTYLYNRARYYKADLELVQFVNDFPLVQKQINSLNEHFLSGCEDSGECEYLIPKDVYPILFSNNGFSVYDTYGFTLDFNYNFHKYLNASFKSSLFLENSNLNNTYSSVETSVNINEGYIRNLSNLEFYYSNTFFSKFSDNQRMSYGIAAEVELPIRLSLIINLGQVYYDSKNIDDNNIDKMTSSSIDFKYNF